MELAEPFLKRAREVSKAKPIVAYYCELYAVQLVLESGTHLENPEVGETISELLNKIENSKIELDQEIINDKSASFEYQFGFASSVFKGAFNKVQNHNVTKSTVLEFKAALDFLKILNLWPELLLERQQEIDMMVKYSKFHAARILKAYKAGENPNDYVTPMEEEQLASHTQAQAFDDGSLQSPELPSVPDEINEPCDDSLPKFTESKDINLPNAPDGITGELDLPTTPVLIKGQKNSLGLPTAPEPLPHVESVSESELEDYQESQPEPPCKPKASQIITKQSIAQTSPVNGHVMTRTEVESVWKRDEVISAAQKKAKFAIGALNYEDIDTAIKELTQALELLKGAQ